MIKEQANNAALTGGVTEIAENPNEVQVAGGPIKTLLNLFEAATNSKPKPKEKPRPKNVAKQTPTGIAESAVLEKDKKSYGRTADYWAKKDLSPEGYKRWKANNKQARMPKPADENVMDTANRALSELEANTPYKKDKNIADEDLNPSLFNFNKAIKKDGKGGLDFNFEHLKTGDDVLNLINGVSEIYQDATKLAKRGVITNKETMANASDLLADELGITKKLFKLGRGSTMNAAEMTAVRGLVLKSAERLHLLARKVKTGSSEDALKFRRQLAIHAAIQMKAKSAQTEIARALQAFNIPVGMRMETLREDAINGVLQETGGKQLAMDMAQGLIDSAESGGRAAINKYARDGWFSNTKKAWQEVYINGLLSYSSTAMKNFFATPIFQMYQLSEEILAGTYGALERSVIRPALGLSRSTVDDGAFIGSTVARFYGWSKSFEEAWLVAAKTWRTESAASFGQHVDNGDYKAISGEKFDANNFWSTPIDYLGKIIRLPGRGLQTVDDFWKTIAQRGELHSQAYTAKKTSLLNGDDAITARDNAIMVLNDPRAVKTVLDDVANYATLTSDLLKLGKLTNAVQNSFWGRILLPFARVPTNAVLRTLERSPLAFMAPSFRKAIMAGPKQRQKALARLTFGTATMYQFHQYATSGRVTGSYPQDPKQQRLLPPGWQPYSLVFRDKTMVNKDGEVVATDVWKDDDGDLLPIYDEYGLPNGPLKYIKYAGLEPVGAVLGISADVAERMRRTDDPRVAGNWVNAASFATFDYFQELPFLQTVGDIFSALKHDDISYLSDGIFRNTITIIPKPYGNATSTLAREYGDNKQRKVSEDVEYYTLEDVGNFPKIKKKNGDMVYEATGTKNPPYSYVGKPKIGNLANDALENMWKKQTKDTFLFGEKDSLAIQYDTLGHPRVQNTARFDIRPGEAIWNIVSPFDVKRGEALPQWKKEIYKVGMPLSNKRRMLFNKIPLSEQQMSDYTNLAKNIVTLRIGREPERKFRHALEYLIRDEKWKTYSLEDRANKIKNLENKFYKKAIDRLTTLPGNEELYQIVQNVRLVMQEINPQIR
tara:strand:+ start:5580 stop:8756 length:3177 start_codon:yes stop_codon:yes gene_type:complete